MLNFDLGSLLLYTCSLTIIFFSGIWLSILLIPTVNHKYIIEFSFLLGICWLILSSSILSYIGLSVKQFAYYLLAFSVLISSFAIYFAYKRGIIVKRLIPSKGQLVTYLIAFSSGIVILLPILLFNAFNAFIDGFTYVSIADYLQNFSYFEKADPNPYFPSLTQMSLYQHFGFRMGFQFILSFFTVLFNEHFSIALFMPVLAVGQFCLVITIYLFCRVGLKLPNLAAIIAVIFTAFHASIPITYSYLGFSPQAYGIFIALFLFVLFLNVISWKNSYSFVLITSISLSTLIVTYSELLPFITLSVLFLMIKFGIQVKEKIKFIVFRLLSIIIVTTGLSNISLYNAYRAIKTQLNAVVGWNIPYTLWDYILIVFSVPIELKIRISNSYPLLYAILTLFVFLGLYLILKNFIKSVEWKEQIGNILVLVTPFLLIICYFLFFVKNPWIPNERGQTWSIYKTVQYSFVLIPPIIGMTFYYVYKQGKLYKYAMLLSGIIFVIFGLSTSYFSSKSNVQEMRQYTGNTNNPLGQYYLLYDQLKANNKPINLVAPENLAKHKQLIAYFLRDHEIISDWSNDGYIYPHLLPENRSPKMKTDGVMLTYSPSSPNRIANMEVSSSNVVIDFKSGVYDLEKNDLRTWRWASGTVDLSLLNFSDDKKEVKIFFEITLPPSVSKSEIIELWYKERLIEKVNIEPNVSQKIDVSVPIDIGESDINIKFSGTPIKVGSDPRNLAFNIINFDYNIE
ncbi:hypothetical protein [Paenibacillus oryzisoli]|uniref:Glycosyltransferase RgtA/B/C/D-like domain-containing protein n=1 Tax=Paenibacillus oryzisoli TaxID=1850517 RepID=A0A198AG79_9BACL|nr:hypothetical protein [Paenibacillus oryzisoli]OAS20524.1 hypothetical protein A8708_18340 [Paenibacillus oryzisoli]